MKNFFILGLIALVKRFRKPLISERKTLLVVSTTGLGDTIWGTPAIRALREKYPSSTIVVLTSGVGHKVLEGNPHIDLFFVWGKKPLWRLFLEMRRLHIDTALIFHTSQRMVLPFCNLLGAAEIIGSAGINKGLDTLLTSGIPRTSVHEIERRLHIVSELGAFCNDPAMELYITKENEREVEAFLEAHQTLSYLPIIAIHPGAKDRFKQWPPEQFIELGNRLVDDLGCQIIVTGNRGEKELTESIASKIKGAIAAHHLSIKGLAALMRKMAVMITNDTGPMHMAFAMRTPTVALFSPTDPRRCGPYFLTSKTAVIAKGPTCTPCLGKKCREPFCMLQHANNDVHSAALRLFYSQ